jgi:hypothetical protein
MSGLRGLRGLQVPQASVLLVRVPLLPSGLGQALTPVRPAQQRVQRPVARG